MIKSVIAAVVGIVIGIVITGRGDMGAAALSGTGLWIATAAAIGVGLLLILKSTYDVAKLLGVALIFTGFGILIGPIAYPG